VTPTILQFDQLHVEIYPDQDAAGRAGAEYVGSKLQEIIAEKGDANIILATGNSQLAFLRVLCSLPGIEWNKVRIFHMDEYVGISPTHPASFVRYIQEKVVDLVQPLAFFPIRGGYRGSASRVRRVRKAAQAVPGRHLLYGHRGKRSPGL